MASRMIISGYPDGSFIPDGDISRAEFTAIIVRALGLPESTGDASFYDCSKGDWYFGYAETAAEYGLMTG